MARPGEGFGPHPACHHTRRFTDAAFAPALDILAWSGPRGLGAQDIRINPVPPGVKPQWTRVPGTPQVSWAPNLPTDVFRYGGKYYFFWENYFYRGLPLKDPGSRW